MNEQLRVRSCSRDKTDAVSRTQGGRQFHQRKTQEGGGNIVNGCGVAAQQEKKKGSKVLRPSAEQTQDGGGGRMNPARTGRCQVGKKELSVLSGPQRTAGASKKKEEERKKERKKEQKCLWSQEDDKHYLNFRQRKL